MPRTRHPKRNAGRSPLSRRPTRSSCSEPGTYPAPAPDTMEFPRTGRLVVPMLEELAALVPTDHLASVRRQVRPGEHVAVYAAVNGEGRGRLIIVGPERAFTSAPASIAEQWRLAGEVEITDDAETSLPIASVAA